MSWEETLEWITRFHDFVVHIAMPLIGLLVVGGLAYATGAI